MILPTLVINPNNDYCLTKYRVYIRLEAPETHTSCQIIPRISMNVLIFNMAVKSHVLPLKPASDRLIWYFNYFLQYTSPGRYLNRQNFIKAWIQ